MTNSHKLGTLETQKHAHRKERYYENLVKMLNLGYSKTDLIHYFPAFAGIQTLNRCFTLYELYKKTLGISGHVAEVGVHHGFGSLLFAKLVQLNEPESLTMCHGFDWFRGIQEDTDSVLQIPGGDASDENMFRELIRLQGLDNVVKIHKLDVTKEFPEFFKENSHLRFKLVFLDSGTYTVTKAAIEHLWPRLNVGGVMIFDQYNNEVAPGETKAIHELLPNQKIETITNSWMPSSYTVKI